MNTTAELAAQLRDLAESDRPELDAEERHALADAAARLEKGAGPVYVIGRLLAPFLGRLVKGKPAQAVEPQAPSSTLWETGWSRHQDNQRAYRRP